MLDIFRHWVNTAIYDRQLRLQSIKTFQLVMACWTQDSMHRVLMSWCNAAHASLLESAVETQKQLQQQQEQMTVESSNDRHLALTTHGLRIARAVHYLEPPLIPLSHSAISLCCLTLLCVLLDCSKQDRCTDLGSRLCRCFRNGLIRQYVCCLVNGC